jgi:hypothetical protein
MRIIHNLLEFESYKPGSQFHVYENVTLKHNIGRFVRGTKFARACFNVELMTLSLADNDSSETSKCGLHVFAVEWFYFGPERDHRNELVPQLEPEYANHTCDDNCKENREQCLFYDPLICKHGNICTDFCGCGPCPDCEQSNKK